MNNFIVGALRRVVVGFVIIAPPSIRIDGAGLYYNLYFYHSLRVCWVKLLPAIFTPTIEQEQYICSRGHFGLDTVLAFVLYWILANLIFLSIS